eukprot:gnl/TRDRNA2_/TRDRNA2_129496_c0_seq2.p1 gnl/TRDRNA2_/TRDRNA2_129496_c0~~gnl/TRDRNA2_/TRDRNA2_129496_c0_seq2.p1  ORF type:complete len:424 (-),score=35.26 gnl/TRDRNA2_/TRDRNA2_129496_c0_seq2:23-1294(-)
MTSVFSCVPAESFVSAALALAGLVQLLRWGGRQSSVFSWDTSVVRCCSDDPGSVAANKLVAEVTEPTRAVYLDNAKFLMNVLVIWGHLTNHALGFYKGPSSGLDKAVRFHIPLAAMLSGATSRGPCTRNRLVNLAVFVIAPALIHRSGFWTWYLWTLTIWRLSSWGYAFLPVTAQGALTLLAGIAVAYSDGSLGRVGHSFFLLPYFFLGQHLDWGHLSQCTLQSGREGRGIVLVGWSVLFGFISLYIVFEPVLDRLILIGEPYRPVWGSMRNLLAEECVSDYYFLWARYILQLMLRGTMALLFFLFCVPQRRVWFSRFGAHTMYPYLLHMYLVDDLVLPIWRRHIWGKGFALWLWPLTRETTAAFRLKGCLLVGLWLLISLAIASLLSTWPLRFLLRVVVEPDWLLCVCCKKERCSCQRRKRD